jgi:hypothetical protein
MLARVDELQDLLADLTQGDLATEHVFHGGMYARTVRLPAGVIVTGTLLRIPTLLIVHGECEMLAGNDTLHVSGYGVLPGSAGRKAVIVTRSPVEMTMIFPHRPTSDDVGNMIAAAEATFTDEHEKLLSKSSVYDSVVITGE